MASSPYPVASFAFTGHPIIGERRAPMVTGFSSRGPKAVVPELLKPDVISPGLNILAAWTGSGDDIPLYKKNHNYRFLSGTSMATPHVTGIAALNKKKHPSWTPPMIRSTVMTTARTLDNMEWDILTDSFRVATPFAAGAGHVHPQLTMDPGMDGTPDGPADLNYPFFIVIFNGHTDVLTLTQTVIKVSQNAETYNVTVVAPELVKVTVTPTTLEFKKQNEKKSYSVEFRSLARGNVTSRWDFGHISWENKDHMVRSPVAFVWKN
ncbi:hypothetical protein PR202_ga29494 [Eleusine coracana subsp. coracana]|uniref:Uncharacterized protein n=1 Tax=Eleusine coracana subsp. coracana TaxID=191504 RepID=A0AAV5DLE1_ELECO|nr:hypothetical protein PR202_ga29494 [Eleusine coracana subsp. coracana]